MKELPTILILQPFNFSTFVTLAYVYTAEVLWKEASLKCLNIVPVGLFPVLTELLTKRQVCLVL